MDGPDRPAVQRVAAPRRGRVALSLWLGALVAISGWVGAASLGSGSAPGPGEDVPSRTPGTVAGASGVPAASPTSTLRPSARPPIEVVAGPAPGGTILLRDGAAVRELDLATGELGPIVGPPAWPARVLRLPDGSWLCVCVERRTTEDGERFSIRIGTLQGTELLEPTIVTEVEGRWDPRVRADEQGDAVVTSTTLSPDGRLLAIGLAVRRPPVWTLSVLVVDVASRTVIRTVDLDPVPSNREASGSSPTPGVEARPVLPQNGVYTWVTLRFSPDGGRLAVGRQMTNSSEVVEEAYWLLDPVDPLDGTRATMPRPVPGLDAETAAGADRCSGAWADFADRDTIFSLCHAGHGGTNRVRIVRLSTGSVEDVPLPDSASGSWFFHLVDRPSGALLLWDPFQGHAIRVDIRGGRVAASTTIAAAAATGPLDVVRALAHWIAPTAQAKIMLEPGMALSPDGTRLYVVAIPGGLTDHGMARTIHVLDARSLTHLDSWSLEGDVVSIAVADGGTSVLAATLPRDDRGAGPAAFITALDASTGRVRAVYGRLGTSWPIIVDPARLGE